MTYLELLIAGIVLMALYSAYCLGKRHAEDEGTTYEIGGEQNEEARKKLLEKEERDIELDGNE